MRNAGIPEQLDLAVRALAAVARTFSDRESALLLRNHNGATEAVIVVKESKAKAEEESRDDT